MYIYTHTYMCMCVCIIFSYIYFMGSVSTHICVYIIFENSSRRKGTAKPLQKCLYHFATRNNAPPCHFAFLLIFKILSILEFGYSFRCVVVYNYFQSSNSPITYNIEHSFIIFPVIFYEFCCFHFTFKFIVQFES